VDIAPLGKGILQAVLTANVGQDPEFHLGVIAGQKNISLDPGLEGPPEPPRPVAESRDVLEVGVTTAEAASPCDGVFERSVDTACIGVDPLKKRMDEACDDLGDLPVLQEHLRDLGVTDGKTG
jgi:hypothetical protein